MLQGMEGMEREQANLSSWQLILVYYSNTTIATCVHLMLIAVTNLSTHCKKSYMAHVK